MPNINIEQLNNDIKKFPNVVPVTEDMHITYDGVSRLIMLDRYAYTDTSKKTLKVGDFVVLTVKPDPKFPARGLGFIKAINGNDITVEVTPEYEGLADGKEVTVDITVVDKPLEVFYEQIAQRVGRGLAEAEEDGKREFFEKEFAREIAEQNIVPAGRVLYGAGSGQAVTFFNCYVMPYPKDSREGIGEHRNKVMEIMSRGGGVGTNGSTLRPRNTLARGVNGKSSGSVSWLNDIAELTHLVSQGGSRRGAQMIMMADWHADIVEFIIAKMQNPKILRFIIESTTDKQIKQLAQEKLKFTPLSASERLRLESYIHAMNPIVNSLSGDHLKSYNEANELLNDGGHYSVHNPEFLSGANISVAITEDFMKAVENDEEYALRFPDVENYNKKEMKYYNKNWHEVGDVREWPLAVKTHRTIKAKELWQLINICATYSAEPGIFFMDNSNDKTNASSYGQKVVSTNPCGKVLASR